MQRPLFLGPFHPQNILADLISDLGGLSGVSFFIFLLALIGLTITWKRKKFNLAYLFLPLLIPVYTLSTQTIFFISIIIIFFATRGFLELLERKWALNNLKKFTIFLLILGIIFSSFTYLERVSAYEPTSANQETLAWIKFNTETDQIVYSTPENSAFIEYFAQREAFAQFSNKQKENISQQVLSSIYIQELFPLLEENEISLLYLTPKMKTNLPADQGLLFLLKNERFKLLHAHEDFEVWEFNLNE